MITNALFDISVVMVGGGLILIPLELLARYLERKSKSKITNYPF